MICLVFQKSFVESQYITIFSSFNKSGIFIYNTNVFQDHDFAPSFATDKDASQEDVNVPSSVSVDPPTSEDTTMSTDAPMSANSAIPVDTTTSTDANMSADLDVAGFSLNSDAFIPPGTRSFQKVPPRTEKKKEMLRNHQF